MVHGILQFTPSIAFRYVLHRCESRDIRCRESFVFTEEARVPPTHAADGARGAGCRFEHSLALSAPGFVGRPPRAPGRARRGRGGGARAECRSTPPARAPRLLNAFAGSFCCAGFDNDPSAGSPTETLLRLLLPLNDKVQWTSRDVAGSEPPTSPRSEHFTGSFNRQIAPPTKNGHAPPPIESRKSSQSVNPYYVWTWCHGAMVPWCLGAMAPRCQAALVPWCLCATVPWCHGACVPQCHGSTVLVCHGAIVPRCLCATVLWCHGACVPSFLGAMVPV
ncbi:hypothetical protein CQW23_35370 [Capsicum baccatum]|uniref:Uncharacterized protein n=1 Tax=Capsicum baccatum TaxID=33114 RepID=A0A2G2UW63_CAPBA|nr:hypothetical protein CQW23_35370 [Capsicum baccatum]